MRNRIPDGESSTSTGGSNVSDMTFMHRFMRGMYDLASRALYYEETRRILFEALNTCRLKLNAWFENAGPDNLFAVNNSTNVEDDPLEDEMHVCSF